MDEKSSQQLQQQAPSAPANNAIPQSQFGKTRSFKKIIGLVLGIVILAGLGVGGWWYYTQGQAMLLIRDSAIDWGNNKYFITDGNIDIAVKDVEYKHLIANDGVDLGQKEVPDAFKGEIKISLSGELVNMDKDFEAKVDFTAKGQDLDMDLSLEAKRIGENFYLRPNIRDISGFPTFFDFSTYENTDEWIVFSSREYSSEFDSVSNSRVDADRRWEELKSKKFLVFEDVHENRQAADGKQKKIKISIPSDMAEEAYIYYASLNLDNSFYDKDKNEEEIRDEVIKLVDIMKERDPEKWQSILDFIRKVNVYIWINTNTKKLQGIDIGIEDFRYSTKLTGVTIDLNYTGNIGMIEQRVIEKPTKTMSLQSFFENRFMEQVENKVLDSDEDGLLDEMEIKIYGTDPFDPDTDDDGFSDKEEVDNGYNPNGPGLLGDPEPRNTSSSEKSTIANIKGQMAAHIPSVILCQDDKVEILSDGVTECNGVTVPVPGTPLCSSPGAPLWPDVGEQYEGWELIACNSDFSTNIFSYGATNGNSTIYCSEEGCLDY